MRHGAVRARCAVPRATRDFPPPELLLAWRRLLHAARVLDDGRSADSVARAMDFSTGSALRKSLKRHTGLRPGELRRQGGFSALATLFLRRCGGEAPAPGARPADRVPVGAGSGRSGYGRGRGRKSD